MIQSPTAEALAEAIRELELYDDDEHQAALALVREIIAADA